jgi:4-amino-4-deoxy-L-arabinose transferase-like glycosyltransferase
MRNSILLFLGCLLFHLAGTWSLPLIDRDEPRFAEASREMRERCEYVIPYFNNQYRFDKPPLTYWCQIASFRAFGENDFAARFPTAIAAALVSSVLFGWGTRLRGKQTGWWAAIVFALALQTFLHGKAAVADMWLVLFFTLAHWSAWELLNANSYRPKWWWIFYLSLALGFLAKGPVGWIPLLSVVLAKWFYKETDFNALFRFFVGIPLTLAIVGAWGVPALMRTNGEFFRVGIVHHVIGRSLAPMEGHGASSLAMYFALLPFYFLTFLVSFFPWSTRLLALWNDLRTNRDATDKFLLSGTLLIFAIFTLVKTKLPHYTLPAFPLIALLLARRFEAVRLSRSAVVWSAGIYLVIALFATPLLAQFFPSRRLVRESRLDLKPEMEFGAIDYTEPSLVWYFRDQVRGFMTTLKRKDAVRYMTEPGPRFTVLPTKLVSEIFPNPDPNWRIYRARGFNIPKGQRVDLTMLLKPE